MVQRAHCTVSLQCCTDNKRPFLLCSSGRACVRDDKTCALGRSVMYCQSSCIQYRTLWEKTGRGFGDKDKNARGDQQVQQSQCRSQVGGLTCSVRQVRVVSAGWTGARPPTRNAESQQDGTLGNVHGDGLASGRLGVWVFAGVRDMCGPDGGTKGDTGAVKYQYSRTVVLFCMIPVLYCMLL